MKDLVEKATSRDTTQRAKLKLLEDDLANFESFRDQKYAMEQDINTLAEEIAKGENDHKAALAAAEREWLSEKARLQRSIEERTEAVKKEAWLEMQRGLDADMSRIVLDNRRLGEELRYQQSTSSDLQTSKDHAVAENKRLRREIVLSSDKEAEYGRQRRKATVELSKLREEVAKLEEKLRTAGTRFVAERAAIRNGVKSDLEEQTLDAAGLRQLVRLKNKELKQIRSLAATVLNQRQEVERFFLEALDDVRAKIRDERKRAAKDSAETYKLEMRTALATSAAPGAVAVFPAIRGGRGELVAAEESGPPSKLPVSDDVKVDLSELTWADKEKVLRLLFAKINSVQGSVKAMPDHQLQHPDHHTGHGHLHPTPHAGSVRASF